MYDLSKSKEVKEEDPNKIYSKIQKVFTDSNKSEIYKVKNRKTGEIFAVKIIKEYNSNFVERIKSLKKFESPYISQFYHSYILNNSIWIVTEFCDCGSVLDIMKITNKCFKENEIASIIIMVLKGLQYLHLQKKYHGGIKPSNILINNEGVVKLSDYNISNQLLNVNNQNNKLSHNLYKMPPELTNKNNTNKNSYSIKCDIWYLGLTCIELAEGNLTFINNKKNREKNMNDIKINNLWSLEFIDFIQKCLSENPANRPSAAILLNHPFIVNNNKGKGIIKKKINSIKNLIDIYREKIDEQEEKINFNDIDIGKDSLEMTSCNENLSLSQSEDINSNSKKNNFKININTHKYKNKSLLNNYNKETKENRKKQGNKVRKIKINIKNIQAKNKSNDMTKKIRFKTTSNKRNSKVSSIKKGDNENNENKMLLISSNNLQRKRHSMVNKYIKKNNRISFEYRNEINNNNNNTLENINPRNNLIRLLNNFETEKMKQIKNVNKSQRLNKNVFILNETPQNKKTKSKNIYYNKNSNFTIRDKEKKNNEKSMSSIEDSLKNSNNEKKIKNSINNNNSLIDKKIKIKTRNKKSNGGNQNLSELIDSNKHGKNLSQKKKKLLRNLILNNSGKNITDDNIINTEINNSKVNSNVIKKKEEKEKEKESKEYPDVNISNINRYSKTPIVYYFKSGEIKRLKRPPLSNSSKKKNYLKKIKQTKKKSVKINTTNINNNNNNININTNNINNTNNTYKNTNNSKNDNDKSDYIDNINNTYFNNVKNNNQSYSYNRNSQNTLTEEDLKILCLNEKINDRGLPELITELAGLENKMNQEIQKIKEKYEPIIKQHKEGIKFLKQNPFLKNIKEYENFENFKKKMKFNTIDDMENRSISSSIHNLNKIKISFYQANDIEELNISANKYIFDKTGYAHHELMKI